MERAAYGLLALLLSLAVAGCEDNLPHATEVQSMRSLGARLEVLGDETRTTPAPGETVRVTIPIVFPVDDENAGDRSADMQSMFIGCTAPDRFTGGLPVCQEIIDAVLAGDDIADALPMIDEDRLRCSDLPPPRRAQQDAVSLQCVNDDPDVENDSPVAVLSVPEGFAAPGLLMLGVICERGDPYIEPLDPLLFGCEEPADGEPGEILRVLDIMTVQQREADENHNPSLDALTVLRQNVEWLPPDPAELEAANENCSDEKPRIGDNPETPPNLHWVVPGPHEITLRYDVEAREQVAGVPEPLELTVYTTLGEMERRFTLFESSDEGEDGVLESVLDWEPPSVDELDDAAEMDETPSLGTLVRFFITVRDQRGGFASTERALCLE